MGMIVGLIAIIAGPILGAIAAAVVVAALNRRGESVPQLNSVKAALIYVAAMLLATVACFWGVASLFLGWMR
jgi:hypothetical protein